MFLISHQFTLSDIHTYIYLWNRLACDSTFVVFSVALSLYLLERAWRVWWVVSNRGIQERFRVFFWSRLLVRVINRSLSFSLSLSLSASLPLFRFFKSWHYTRYLFFLKFLYFSFFLLGYFFAHKVYVIEPCGNTREMDTAPEAFLQCH